MNGIRPNIVTSMLHTCVRCTGPGAALMAFDYGDAEVWIEDLTQAPDPGHGYVLCGPCGDRMTPPLGWRLSDRRNTTQLFSPIEVDPIEMSPVGVGHGAVAHREVAPREVA